MARSPSRCTDTRTHCGVHGLHSRYPARVPGLLPSCQVDELLRRGERLDAAGRPWLLAGDFNALPPPPAGIDYRVPLSETEAALYPERESPIAPLYDAFSPAVSAAAHATAFQTTGEYFTYKCFEAEVPDRVIDHAFVGPAAGSPTPPAQLVVDRVEVVKTDTFLSDHQPVAMSVRLLQSPL